MISKNYPIENVNQATDHIDMITRMTTLILSGVVNADFTQIEQAQIQMEKSRQVLKALHNKKLQQDEFNDLNHAIYKRKGWAE